MKTRGSILTQTRLDDLSERIKIIRQNFVSDDRGQRVTSSDTKIISTWAKVFPLSAKISDNKPTKSNTIDYRVIIRYRTDILPDDLIIWRDKQLTQTAPPYDAESRRIWTVLNCREVVEDG